MLEYLKSIIPLKQTQKKSVWVSSTCPFNTECVGRNKRRFRYNHKLGVAKCYSCGQSAKELSWLIFQRNKPTEYKIKMVQTSPFLKYCRSGNEIMKKEIQRIKDKANTNHEVIVKSEWDDLSLPF
jgi:hypothetical protein